MGHSIQNISHQQKQCTPCRYSIILQLKKQSTFDAKITELEALEWLLEQQKEQTILGMAVKKEIDYDVFTNAMDKQALDCDYRA